MPGFKNVPSSIRTPGFYFEVDNSQANNATAPLRTLIIGQMLASGTATPNVPAQCAGLGDSKVSHGVGSMLATMVRAYAKRDPTGQVWTLPLSDDGSAAAATATLTLTGAPTAAGTLTVYVNGVVTPVAVTTSSTLASIAAAVAAAVNAATDHTVTASSAAGVVTFTTRFKGAAANDCDVRVNYLGSAAGEATPAGLTATTTAFTGGTANPSLTAGLAALGDQPFDFIVCPYTDATSLAALQALLSDTSGRWSWASQVFGGYFSAYRGTLGARTAFGVTRNDQHGSIISFGDSPSPTFVWAANYAGACAASLKASPATPLQTLALDVLAPAPASRDTQAARNTLLYDGLATYTVDSGGTVRIDSAITTYQSNAFGQPDDSYLQVETLYTLAQVLRTVKGVISSKYARVNIVDDGTYIPAGAAAVTPKMIKSDIVAACRQMEGLLLDNVSAFVPQIQVTRNAQNPRRVDVLFPPTIIKGLQVFAVLAQFR